jgi:excisionase family DNA binding protein
MTHRPLVDTDGDPIEHEFEVLLTPREAASLLAVNTRTLAKYARNGQLRSVRTRGNHRRYPADAVRAASEGRWDDAADTARTSAQKSPADVMIAIEG